MTLRQLPTPPDGPADPDSRAAAHATRSGIPVDAVYGSDPPPGAFPYTRGIHPEMYRVRPWTMRMFAGFGSAADTNGRFLDLLRAGGTGLSTAFDMPTLMGLDSDDPRARGEVGRAGVAVDTLADVATLYAGIDLGAVTTSMTVNGPAPVLLAMYVAAAEQAGTPRAALGGTLQNDILKEYQAQKEYIYPPRPSVRLVTDVIAFTSSEMPRWNPVSVSGYHIREAGSTAVQELAFTLANGFAYVESSLAAGLDIDVVAPRLSFFFNCHSDFFEEIAKLRAARRIWATWMRDRYGAQSPKSMQCRFHVQTAGVSLTAAQPELNVARVAIQALAAVLGGTQSLHTDAFDEALALPTEHAARLALRTQQMIAAETGVTEVADPLGGSAYLEWLTDELERRAQEVFAHLDDIGGGSILEGVYAGIEDGWFVGEIADAAYREAREIDAGRRTVVGVNAFNDAGDGGGSVSTLRVDPRVEADQIARLGAVRAGRDAGLLDARLAAVTAAASDPVRNVMPAIIDAVEAYASVGDVTAALGAVFGGYVEPAVA
jgi:methylmalonyl-CoA mutase, N-terminal domain